MVKLILQETVFRAKEGKIHPDTKREKKNKQKLTL